MPSWPTARSIKFGLLPDNLGADIPRGIAELIQRLRTLGAAEAEEIAARFPSQLRRVGGYNIDVLTPVGAARRAGEPGAAAGGFGRHARLLRGDRAYVFPIKPRKLLGICQFATFRARDGGCAAYRAARPRGC